MKNYWGFALILAGIYILTRKKTLTMPLDELIAEHRRIVELLAKSPDPSLKQELQVQRRELEGYIRAAS